MLVTFGSTAYLGIPYATFAFKTEGTAYASLLSVVLVITLLFLNLMVLNRATTARLHRSLTITMLELPFIWAALLGIALPLLALPSLPIPVTRLIAILADSAGPTALLGLGTFLFDIKLKDVPWRAAVSISALKVIAPTLSTFFILQWLDVRGVRLAVGVAMAGVSTAVTCFVLSEQYRIGEKLTAGTILVSTFFSLIILSAVSVLWIGTTIFQ